MLYSYIPTYILIFNLYYFRKTHATNIYCFVNKIFYSLLCVGYITTALFLKALTKNFNYLLDLLNFLIYQKRKSLAAYFLLVIKRDNVYIIIVHKANIRRSRRRSLTVANNREQPTLSRCATNTPPDYSD